MSDQNLPEVRTRPDFTTEEMTKLGQFHNNGLPGISKVTQSDIETMRRMYLDGSLDYLRIARDMGIKHEKVLYFAYRENWYKDKMERIESVVRSLENHKAVRADSIVFLQEVVSVFQKYYRDKMKEIYRTGETVKVVESMQMRYMEKYAKMLTLFESMVGKAREAEKEGNQPLVNLSLSGEATVKQNADGSIDVSTHGAVPPEDIKTILKTLADMKRTQEEIEENKKQKK